MRKRGVQVSVYIKETSLNSRNTWNQHCVGVPVPHGIKWQMAKL